MAAALHSASPIRRVEVEMLKRLCAVCACVLVASTAAAATIVTWQGDGTILRRTDKLLPPEPGHPLAPPLGTPLSVTLTFDPASAVQVSGGDPGCLMVSLSGSLSIGSDTFTAGSGSYGFTNSALPGTLCNNSGETHFSLLTPPAPESNEFDLPRGIFILSYFDELVQDAFPSEPHTSFLAHVQFLNGNCCGDWIFDGQVQLRAVDQTAAVPEPGTMTLLALGLAAVYRKRRANIGEDQ
jgi:hypothetical protein